MVKTLIFVHGWGSTPEIWARQREYFSKDYEVILPDISTAKDVKEAANIVCGVVKGRDYSVLIGWSLGWFVILELLKNFDVKPKGLIGVNSTAKFVDDGYLDAGPKDTHLAKVIRDCKRDPKKALEDFYKTVLSDNGKEAFVELNLPELDYNNLIYGLDILKNADYREFIEKLNFPTLLIAGKSDTICPKEASVYMHKKIRPSELKILDSRHMPFLSKADEFNSLIENFVKGL